MKCIHSKWLQMQAQKHYNRIIEALRDKNNKSLDCLKAHLMKEYSTQTKEITNNNKLTYKLERNHTERNIKLFICMSDFQTLNGYLILLYTMLFYVFIYQRWETSLTFNPVFSHMKESTEKWMVVSFCNVRWKS